MGKIGNCIMAAFTIDSNSLPTWQAFFAINNKKVVTTKIRQNQPKPLKILNN
jgi:hypothetical protein